MDRSVLEGDPHAVLEAMAIAGYAIGSDMGYIYVRAEYPVAVERLKKAIEQAKEYGLIGKKIFGTDFDFDLEIRLGAGAFVCGEETALIVSIEGRRGEPRPKPPYPANKGLFGKPTIINNVETFANVPQIIMKGAEWFASMGTETSKGTKIFALGGKIKNTGLVEIPMGTTLREIIYDIGGGIPNGKKFKAAQTGGPSGGCIPAKHLDTPIDYESLLDIGSMMGSGGLIIMDEDNCMVDVARFYLDFTVDESCGKCPPCRIGTKRMLEILERIVAGKGEEGDVEKLEILGKNIKEASLCGLGKSAPNPVLSTIKYFRDEYDAHINDKKCPAGYCKALLNYVIDKGQVRRVQRVCQGVSGRLYFRRNKETVCDRPDGMRQNAAPASRSASSAQSSRNNAKGENDNMVSLTIDGVLVKVPENTTVLEAAREADIDIPTLCYYKGVNALGGCRMCLIEQVGKPSLQASCVLPVEEGMEIKTKSARVLAARKVNLELILSNHQGDCQTCIRNRSCELQHLCEEIGVDEIRFEGEYIPRTIDKVSASIIRDQNKCILCRRCVAVCHDIQKIGVIGATNRGFNTTIEPVFGKSIADVPCINCGQCIVACPAGALREKNEIDDVWEAINDPDKHVVIQTAPAVRVALGEEFGMPMGTVVTGKMVAALRKLGADKVFDTDFAADLTIMEEGNELLGRIKSGKNLPMITSCSPGWVKYCEHYFPDFIDNLSTCKSPHQMLGAIIKSYYAEKNHIGPPKRYSMFRSCRVRPRNSRRTGMK